MGRQSRLERKGACAVEEFDQLDDFLVGHHDAAFGIDPNLPLTPEFEHMATTFHCNPVDRVGLDVSQGPVAQRLGRNLEK